MHPLKETSNVEFKESWKDDYLKQVCSFANAQGGVLYIGIADDGSIVGLDSTSRLLEEIPNKLMNLMGILPMVEFLAGNEREYLRISIPPSSQPVSFRGRFYVLSGTTTQELNGTPLQDFLLKRLSVTWDQLGDDRTQFSDINPDTVKRFIEYSIAANRLSTEARTMEIPVLFANLHLLDHKQRISRAAILAFAYEPMKFFPSMVLKIGRYMSLTELVTQDFFECNLFTMIERCIETIKTKYLNARISYNGIH